jgi:hypothetical protein
MNPVECEFEADVLAAVLQSRWPNGTDAALRSHVAGCAICSDVVAVAGMMDASREELRVAAQVPDSGRVWWVAQMRARREAARTAGRPITVAHVLAFACAMGLMGACFGATSEWFQGALRRLGEGFDLKQLLTLAGTVIAAHSGLALLVLGLIVAIPGAIYWVVVRE